RRKRTIRQRALSLPNWYVKFISRRLLNKQPCGESELIKAAQACPEAYVSDIPQREPDLDAFLSIKPGIPPSQELEQVRGRVGQIEHHEALSRHVAPMNPHEVMEHPTCGRVLEALAFLVRQGGRRLPAGGANPILQGSIPQQADRHHPHQGHEARGLFAVER